MATQSQIKAIWALSRKRGLSREQLYELARTSSLSSLSFDAAGDVIQRLGGVDRKPARTRSRRSGRRDANVIASASKAQRGYIRDLLCQITLNSSNWPTLLADKFGVRLDADLAGPLSDAAAHALIGGLKNWVHNRNKAAQREATS